MRNNHIAGCVLVCYQWKTDWSLLPPHQPQSGRTDRGAVVGGGGGGSHTEKSKLSKNRGGLMNFCVYVCI